MNKLAQELNEILSETAAFRMLSDFGRRLFFPKGIITQTGEAKQYAHKFNVTVGMAFNKGEPIFLPSIRKNFPGLSAQEVVAYAPTSGDEELRTLWKQEIIRKNPDVNPDAISTPMAVSGLTNGLVLIADLFMDPGDVVIIPDMFWGNYRLMFEVRKGGKIVSFPFFNENNGLNIEGFKQTILEHKGAGKVILLVNFPNNPTGYSPRIEEAEALATALKECADQGVDILAVTDDAYFGLFYEEGTYTHSLFSKCALLHERILAVKVDGATKEDYVWGFRVGFITFGGKGLTRDHYEALNKKLMGAIRSSISNGSRPAQTLLKKGLKDPNYISEKEEYYKILKRRYEKVKQIVSEHSSSSVLTPLPFNSGYFMSFVCSSISAEELRTELLHKEGIGSIAIGETYLRIAYAGVDEEDLEELYSTIYQVAERLSRS